MRSLRSMLFICVAFLFLGSFAVTDAAVADDHHSSSSVAVPVPDHDAGSAVATEALEQSTVSKVLEAFPDWLQALSLLGYACAAIAALTPTPKDDGVISALRKLIDFAGLNFGGAKNASRSKNNFNSL